MTRIAIIKKDKCNLNKCNFLCATVCPINRAERDCITEVSTKARIDELLCNGCGICAHRCPYQAISVLNLPEELKEDPIHRYGENAFELFSLPFVKKNTIIGIIGRNGIGKSTALGILAGNIKPNLGNYNNPPSNEDLIKKYSTSWLADYFTKLFSKKIKISYKPQRIELLPEVFKGKVIDLLKNIDERNILSKLIKELEIDNIKDREFGQLSGGELQRVAIIAAAIKKADVYYFDEPSSFLDITYRIKIAKLIREIVETENAAVIVIEHDLATLDYISDEIQIVYGEPSCYGIFSQSKSVRRGINEYLEGKLDSENIRFRDYQIKFFDSSLGKTFSEEVLFEIPELSKKFSNFSLNVNQLELHKGEVLCIMGANGLGKSTFLNLLSGNLDSDTNKVEIKDISYKKQSLESMDKKVIDYLKEKAGAEFSSGWYEQNILKKLNIQAILMNNLKDLSGGELQKVHIAANLSGNTKLVLMDEPSAFIDVEDRLNVAEVIKEFVIKKEITAIVVDHDIQFIDHLADSMLVFEGVPGKKGLVNEVLTKREGMNKILKMLDITYRKDPSTNRPRINKLGSQLDREQRQTGNYYYI
ncbi:MAG: ribosome biogenesis/translation initiation ATPase RLI [Candidatus Nanoarchaeia archaeon]|nr:ribosome biogenesis/translation initiation ATPase RLI [Candidatus Nanoarchaeia archaeon]